MFFIYDTKLKIKIIIAVFIEISYRQRIISLFENAKNMKNILESEKTFMAYATIDMNYYLIQQMQSELNKPLTPIQKAINKASGWEENYLKDLKSQMVGIMESIIASKKIIDADYSGDEKALKELLETSI